MCALRGAGSVKVDGRQQQRTSKQDKLDRESDLDEFSSVPADKLNIAELHSRGARNCVPCAAGPWPNVSKPAARNENRSTHSV